MRPMRAVMGSILEDESIGPVSREEPLNARQQPLSFLLPARFDHAPIAWSKGAFKKHEREASRIEI